MRWFQSRALLLALLVTPWAPIVAARGETEPPPDRGVGQRVEDFQLTEAATGKPLALYDFAGKQAAVLVFLGIDCPVGDLYLPRLQEIANRYESRGVVVLGINANDGEPAERVVAHAREHGVRFPVLKDSGNVVADRLMAARTCEVLVIDGRARLRYRGAIDDQYGLGRHKDRPAASYLTDALDAVLAGRPVEPVATDVVGCPIKRTVAEVPPYRTLPRISSPTPELIAAYEEVEGTELPEVGEVTYAGEVASILQSKCQTCHRPGQVGRFSLLTYDDARRWSTSIWEVIDDRRMPPWHADPRYGHFEGARRLTPEERATLIAWVEQGSPPGDLAAAPPNPSFPEGWTLGTPDVVFEMPTEYTVAAGGVLPYQHFRVKTGFLEDRWISAAEAQPGDREVVHHIIVYLLDPENPRRREHLCGYAPGDMPTVLPPGVAKKIPAGAELLFELHYTPIGRVRVDRSRVGFTFARGPVTHEAVTRGIANTEFAIPPGAPNHEVIAEHTLGSDALLLSFMPHMHLRGKDFRYTAEYPDGRVETLLSVPSYDFNWQSYYRLARPLHLPRGTRIVCVAHFNNSSTNPALTAADTARRVTWGDQTSDEMMIGYIDYIPRAPAAPSETR